MSIAGGIISILDWAKDKIPIQGRVERWKNELDNLQKEYDELTHKRATVKAAQRLLVIDKRIKYLTQLLKNKVEA